MFLKSARMGDLQVYIMETCPRIELKGVFKSWLGYKVSTLMMRMSDFNKEDAEMSVCYTPHRLSWKMFPKNHKSSLAWTTHLWVP